MQLGLQFQTATLNYLCLAGGTLRYLAEARTGVFDATFVQKDASVGDQMRLSVRLDASGNVISTVRNVTKDWTVTRSAPGSFAGAALIGTEPVEGTRSPSPSRWLSRA